MIHLFLKLYGVLLATLVVSFLLQIQLMDFIWKETSIKVDFRVRFVPTFHLIDEALAGLPRDQWPLRFRELAAGFGVPARLTTGETFAERERFRPEQVEAFGNGALVSLDRDGGGFTLARRLRAGGAVVAIDYPGTNTARVRMITYLANWAIEFARRRAGLLLGAPFLARPAGDAPRGRRGRRRAVRGARDGRAPFGVA